MLKYFKKLIKQMYKNDALLKAITENNLEKIQELLDKGVDVNANLLPNWNPLALLATYWRRYSPLHCALGWSSVEIIAELIRRGADVNEIHSWLTFQSEILSYRNFTTIELGLYRSSAEDKVQIITLLLQNDFVVNKRVLEIIKEDGYTINPDGEATPFTKALISILKSDFQKKSDIIASIEATPDNALCAKKPGLVPSLFIFAATKLLSHISLDELAEKKEINSDIIDRIETIKQNNIIYNKVKPQVESYKSFYSVP